MNIHKEIAFHISFLILISISACALSPKYIAEPSIPSPTAATVSEIDLPSFLKGLIDLPPHLSVGSITRAITPLEFSGFDPDNYVYHEILWDGSESGEVVLFIYESRDQARVIYSTIVDRFEESETENGGISLKIATQPITELGEEGMSQVVSMGISTSRSLPAVRVDVAFVRCSAVVDIRLNAPPDLDVAIAYARRLDQGLALLVCR